MSVLTAANFPWTAVNRRWFLTGVAATFAAGLIVPAGVLVGLGKWAPWSLAIGLGVTLLVTVLFAITYAGVGRRVDALRAGGSAATLCADCRIVHNVMESPGLAEIRADRLLLRPIIGRELELPLAEISVDESRWLNGERLWGDARAFRLHVPDTTRVAFAVEDPEPWRRYLKSAGSAVPATR